jgi:glycosyltransferase involved in cell wall biosynthesis
MNVHSKYPPLAEAARATRMRGEAPRVTINGRFLTQNFSGVQRFATETVKAIDRLLDDESFHRWRGRIEIVAPREAHDFLLRNIPLRRCGRKTGYFWEQVELPWHTSRELLLNLCMLGPVAVRRQIVVVHDATVKALPENFSWPFRFAYGALIPPLCRRSALAVTVSEFSRREIGRLYGVDTDDMPVCSEGGDHITATPADPHVIERLGLAGRKFFISVGVNSRNKNADLLVNAFAQAGLSDALLVFTGKGDPAIFGELAEFKSDAVRKVGQVNDSELRALYEQALALVFPSRYEGFGLPPLEAMSCGCPVITSDQPALIEVGGDAALRCGMDDVAGLARLLSDVAADAALRRRLGEAGRARAAHFTWAATARRMLDYCDEVG